jgi:hypothetical protein
VDVEFTEEQYQTGTKHAAEVYEEVEILPNYDLSKITTGGFGQGADTFILLNDANLGLQQMLKGQPDEQDLIYKGRQIDMKAFLWLRASEPNSWMLVPFGQFMTRVYDYYIANELISIKPNVVSVLGFISGAKLERVGVLVGPQVDCGDQKPEYSNSVAVMSLKHLTPIKDFDKVLDGILEEPE